MHINPKHPFPEWRFLQLTVVIVAWMLLAPHLETRWSGHLAIHVMLLNLILVTMWANPDWRKARLIVGGLWLLGLIASLGSVLELAPALGRIEKTLDVGFIAPVTAACSVGVLAFAFRAERPTMDGIFAMVVAYLLIAMLFTELYYLTLVWDPQAMHLLKPFEEMKPSELRGELLYFSMVTISTVGYGDVLRGLVHRANAGGHRGRAGPVLRRRAGRNVRRHVRIAAVRQPRRGREGERDVER